MKKMVFFACIVLVIIAINPIFGIEQSQNTWINKNPSSSPPPRQKFAMAYDTVNKVVILFGGKDSSGNPLGDTWVYSLSTNTWKNMNPSIAPSARFEHAMVYDSANKVVVLFGGSTGSNSLSDTWTYEYSTNTWTKKSTTGPNYGRCGHAMTYDSNSKAVILFAGSYYFFTFRLPTNDVWIYKSNIWNKKNPPSPTPGVREYHSIAYDPQNKVVVAFGGSNASGKLNDTWEYSLSANKWVQKSPSVVPEARYGHSLTYSTGSKTIIMFGGYALGCAKDTWSYDTKTGNWTNLNPSTSPPERRFHSIVDVDGTVILYGGDSNGAIVNDTWAYTTAPTMKVTVSANPSWVYSGGTSSIKIKVTYQGSPVNSASVTITDVTNGGSCTPSSGTTDANGEFSTTFKAPTVTANTTCTIKIKVTKSGMADVFAKKDIQVCADPSIKVGYPNGGEKLMIGNTYQIKWTSANGAAPKSVKIEYSTQGSGGPWIEINNGSYSKVDDGNEDWTIPDKPSTNCYIKITLKDAGSKTVFDTSDKNFTIAKAAPLSMKVITPDGGEIWGVGTTQTIKWDASGGVGTLNIKLEYSTTGSSGNFKVIVDNHPNSGSYSWTVPNEPSNDCWLRATVTDGSSPPQSVLDMSDNAFKIVSKLSIEVKDPNGGEVWYSGLKYNINWTTGGGSDPINVTIKYSINGASGPWYEINNGSYSHKNDGTETWTIPNVESPYCYVLVQAEDSSTPSQKSEDKSDKNFTIEKLSVSTRVDVPDGGEIWFVGEQRHINWTASGGVGVLNITIEYSNVSQGGPYKVIVENYTNTGTYQWTVPNEPSQFCYIRITAIDEIGTTAQDTSDSAFTIEKPPEPLSISIDAPTEGENLTVGSIYNIKWTVKGGAGTLTVKLEYRVGTGSYKHIADELPAKPGIYAWKVPDEQSEDCYIHAIVVDDAQPTKPAEDTSKNFTIWHAPDTEKPIIEHTPVTTGMENVKIQISAKITDNVEVSDATLCYRQTGTSTYIRTVMKSIGDNYTGTIPASKVTIVGIQYYLEANDTSGNSATDPEEITKPYIIKVYPSSGTISGKVVDTEENPVENCNVRLFYAQNGSSVATATTDTTGNFTFKGLCFTSYNITITKQGFENLSIANIQLTKDNPCKNLGTIKISKLLGSISGRVLDRNTNKPIFNVFVNVTYFNITKTTTTDSNGKFIVKGLEIGIYDVKISKKGYINVTKEVKITTDELEVDIGTIRLTPKAPSPPTKKEPFRWEFVIIGVVITVCIIAFLIIAFRSMKRKEEAKVDLEQYPPVWSQPPPTVPQPVSLPTTPTQIPPQPAQPPSEPEVKEEVEKEEEKIDVESELKKLEELRDSGTLSQEEFEYVKRGLLKKAGVVLREQEKPTEDYVEEFRMLKEKYQTGLISDEEYEKAKRDLLRRAGIE